MIEPAAFTVERAQKLIEQMKLARPQCKECNYVPIGEIGVTYAGDYAISWKHREVENVHRSSELFQVIRCARCAGELKWPFAPQLDAQRVADYINKAEGVFNLSELVHTLDNVVYGACTVSVG